MRDTYNFITEKNGAAIFKCQWGKRAPPSITAGKQMCYLLNLIYFIMGLNNASLFHNEQSNM